MKHSPCSCCGAKPTTLPRSEVYITMGVFHVNEKAATCTESSRLILCHLCSNEVREAVRNVLRKYKDARIQNRRSDLGPEVATENGR